MSEQPDQAQDTLARLKTLEDKVVRAEARIEEVLPTATAMDDAHARVLAALEEVENVKKLRASLDDIATDLQARIDAARAELAGLDAAVAAAKSVADASADQTSTAIAALKLEIDSLTEAHGELQAKFSTELESKLAEVNARLDDATTSADAKWKEVLDTSVQSVRATIATMNAEAATRFGEQTTAAVQQIEAQKTRLDSLITDWATKSTTLLTTEQQAFAEQAELRRKEAVEEAEKQRAAAEALRKQFTEGGTAEIRKWVDQAASAAVETKKEVEQLLARLRDDEQKAQDLLGVVVATTLSGAYEKQAAAAKSGAERWRVGAIAVLLIWVGFAGWVYHDASTPPDDIFELMFPHAGINWMVLSTRVLAAVALAGLSSYVIRQASRFEIAQRRYQQMALELAAIDPYLQSLPGEQRHEVKRALAERIFAQPEAFFSDKSASTGDAMEALNKLAKQSPELVKAFAEFAGPKKP